MQAETSVTRPPEAVLMRASSTVFWKASKVRKRDLPIAVVEEGGEDGETWRFGKRFRSAVAPKWLKPQFAFESGADLKGGIVPPQNISL
jgi:hypothetical protein